MIVSVFVVVHAAETVSDVFTAFAEWERGNVSASLSRRLVAPGLSGAIVGLVVVLYVDGRLLRPWFWVWLVAVGARFGWQEFRAERSFNLSVVRFFRGLIDTMGGGGRRPIVTGHLLGTALPIRLIRGTASAAELFVTIAGGGVLSVLLEAVQWEKLFLGGTWPQSWALAWLPGSRAREGLSSLGGGTLLGKPVQGCRMPGGRKDI